MKCIYDCSDQSAGDSVVSGEKRIFLKEALAASAAVAALPKVQEGVSRQRDILDRLHSIVVNAVCDGTTGRADVCFPGQLE